MDYIFLLGIFLLPFENLKFAPSSGWAAITPLIWFIYVIINSKRAFKSILKYKKIIFFLIFGLTLSLINYIFIDVSLKNLINTIVSISMGMVSLVSWDIYFVQKEHGFNKIVKVILLAYTIALIMGVFQFIAIKFHIDYLKSFFIAIEKRSYIKVNRVQYTFSEPSFIGMHLFGILLPIYMITKEKKILKLILAFSVCSIIFSSGIRVLLDILIVGTISIICKNLKNWKVIVSFIVIVPMVVFGFRYVYKRNNRVKAIINNGIYADTSLAVRYFRINASVLGLKKNPIRIFWGYGMGNSIIPLKEGYNEAIKEYENADNQEVRSIGKDDFTDDNVSFCLYVRIITEFGIFLSIYLLIYLINLNKYIDKENLFKLYLPIMLYLYIQFDSYAFYSLWIYIVICTRYKGYFLDSKTIQNINTYKTE